MMEGYLEENKHTKCDVIKRWLNLLTGLMDIMKCADQTQSIKMR